MEYHLYPLHERTDLLENCADMLNAEWKRSFGSRSNMLLQSNDDLPLSLLLAEVDGGQEELVGHVRLSNVVGNQNAVLMSSVIISKERRRQGFGRKLLQLTHEYLKNTQFSSVYLRTDSPEFYEKCGYKQAEPVDSFSTRNATLTYSIANLQLLMQPQQKEDELKIKERKIEKETEARTSKNTPSTPQSDLKILPPSPPPPPKITSFNNKNTINKNNEEDCGKIWLKRHISQTD